MKPPAPEMEASPLPADRQSNGSKSDLPNYDEICERAANFNSKLLKERKTRLPFIDSHTGIAQKNCHLWFKAAERQPSSHPHHICTYPQRRWRKRKRPSTLMNGFAENGESSHSDRKEDQDNAIKQTFEKWYDELDLINEEMNEDDRISDVSDFEAEMKGKKKKRGPGRGRKKKDDEEKDKPYACELCGARYKTRAGLTYHYNHFHSGEPEPEPPEPKQPEKPQVQDFCDFCLGDASENKKTKKPEQLFSCSVCGHSGHPSCLQFTQNMIISVKKYPWQCIECKSCGLCGTSDNDDQLLFCDDCDRGYHMYCLRPPLTEPPEGSWSCQLCIEEFHGGKDPSKPSTSSS